jgi:hypothetical protein
MSANYRRTSIKEIKMTLLKDKWVWISAAIGAVLAITLSMVFVAAAAAPAQPNGTITPTNTPVYGGTAEFDTTAYDVKKTYDLYVTLVCQEKYATNPTYVQASVFVDRPNGHASFELRDYYTGPGGFRWHWNGERAECAAWLTARSPVAAGKSGYDMPVLAKYNFVIPEYVPVAA